MPNRLAQATSPYLLQHADNPVDWYPWGAEALKKAQLEGKPILLSIGYAACHWCHVMEHESFEDTETARLMNEHFVSVKVDREERPDLDAIYMQAVQAMTGHGGWPMTVFLTPDGAPFYGGTYFPPDDRHGLPSFRKILLAVADAYRNRRDAIAQTADQLQAIYRDVAPPEPEATLSSLTLELAFRSLAQQYDVRTGGFGGAPKFPPTMALDFLLRYWRRTETAYALEMAVESFRHMARGGIYDQIGGGFARYSVDANWLVPHFEKMLYDNALLVRLGAHIWQATGDAEVRRAAEETLEWIEREMTSPETGFYSSLDADSEGEEGKFYVWNEEELDTVLGGDATLVKAYFGVSPGGNFEGKSILHVASGAALVAARHGTTEDEVLAAVARARTVLYEARARRVWPGRDDKIVASWNGLMLRAAAESARAFQNHRWHALALKSAGFLRHELVRDGRAYRVHRNGVTHTPGFLEDQAGLALGFLAVYQLTFDSGWLALSREMAAKMVELFRDRSSGTFYDTAHDAERLIARPRDVTDNAIPSGSSMAAELLVSLADITSDSALREIGASVVAANATALIRYPTAFGHLLGVADALVNGTVQVALVGDVKGEAFQSLERVVATTYVPSLVIAGGDAGAPGVPELLQGRSAGKFGAMSYVCRGFACRLPTSDPVALARELESAVANVHEGEGQADVS